MTDTRKEFDEWKTKRDIETNNSPIMPFEIWQACQQLNDNRIQQLLAVIAKQKEVLTIVNDTVTHGAGAFIKDSLLHTNIEESLALTADDVELVEVGKVNEVGGSLWASQYSPNNGVKVGDIVYTIKTKG